MFPPFLPLFLILPAPLPFFLLPFPSNSLCVSLLSGCRTVNIFSLHCLLAVVFHLTKAHHNGASQSETETVSQNKYCLQVMHLRCLIHLSYELCLHAISWRKISKKKKVTLGNGAIL